MQIPEIKISDYNYNLPDSAVAKYPLPERDKSKLLVYHNNTISEDVFSNIHNYLDENTLLVFNNAKVIPARTVFQKATGAQIEIFLLEPVSPKDYFLAFQETEKSVWKCFVGNLRKWKGETLHKEIVIDNVVSNISATCIKKEQDEILVEFSWTHNFSFAQIISNFGAIPIPPYLNRNTEEIDKSRYQTVYSKTEGSVAAPTAGLHFTQDVFENLKLKNIKRAEITLHIGAGTFKPVKSENIADHNMHIEHFSVSINELRTILANIGNITSVGTTSLRTLESIYWIGVKLISNSSEPFIINQWDNIRLPQNIEPKDAINQILAYLQDNNLEFFNASTQIFIVPGYKIKMANRIITNFHQPQSSLLLLISAIVGNQWKVIYDHALSNNFRFLSYGDSSILSISAQNI